VRSRLATNPHRREPIPAAGQEPGPLSRTGDEL